jgi:hypothetical protein
MRVVSSHALLFHLYLINLLCCIPQATPLSDFGTVTPGLLLSWYQVYSQALIAP